jgi:drug/metabolite transporter (DMT)-like permease
MQSQKTKEAYFQLHTAVFLFGFTGILGRLITIEATMLVWHRLWLTALMMFAYVWYIGKWKRLPFAELFRIAAISSTITIHWVLFYLSIKMAGVALAMICLSSITLFTALLEPLLLNKPLPGIHLVFSVFVILGVYFMAEEQHEQFAGILVGLASSFFSALFTVLNKTIVHKYDSRLLSLYEMGFGFVLLTLSLPLIDMIMPLELNSPSGYDWLYLVLLASFCTVLAFNLSLSSLKQLSPFTVNLAINLEPVYGILLAFVIFKEYELLGPGFYIGSAFILLAVLGEVIWKRYRPV